ncbi:MAG: glycine C-acetyltransferase [Clostridia bacterium]|nr:glycine C-acetyltransferase [Deltaproteobacteria bacterium]
MREAFLKHFANEAKALEKEGLFKRERVITSPQRAVIDVGAPVLNLCANNYLGLAADPEIIADAHKALDTHGYGMASVRFICGTQDVHIELESAIASFVGCEDTILYSSCWDANGGVFETILGEEDAVISDALNHASIIDGIRLCKAKRLRYANNDMTDLERALKEADGARFKLIVTDGVFSMDGTIANLNGICELADRYGALTMVDDSHAIGFVGAKGRGTPEYCDVFGKIDIITGTLGKALGGASGGYTSARKEVVTWLRQRSRPYLFSNSLAPAIAATSLAILKRLSSRDDLREKLRNNTQYFRKGLSELGFDLKPGEHPIIPVMLGDAALASSMADKLLAEGIYVVGFSFPVVPKGQARIRTQMSAGLERAHLDRAITAFGKVGRELGVIR